MKYKDPICGMTVTDETAVSIVEWEGKAYGFCAEYSHILTHEEMGMIGQLIIVDNFPPASLENSLFYCFPICS